MRPESIINPLSFVFPSPQRPDPTRTLRHAGHCPATRCERTDRDPEVVPEKNQSRPRYTFVMKYITIKMNSKNAVIAFQPFTVVKYLHRSVKYRFRMRSRGGRDHRQGNGGFLRSRAGEPGEPGCPEGCCGRERHGDHEGAGVRQGQNPDGLE